MRNIRVILEYDGTNYHGFQIQKNSIAIQKVVEDVVSTLTKEDTRIIFASRTDAGVHAEGQVINFYTQTTIPANRFAQALNSLLPADIIAKNSEETAEEFHARFNACSKLYRYSILNRQYPSAFLRNYVHHYKAKLDVDLMIESAKHFTGRHDFSAFCATGSDVKTFTRTVKELEIKKTGHLIDVFIEADGFLYNMVRIIVGTLIEVGRKKIAPEQVRSILSGKDRNKAGPTAPAKGLCLIKVNY